MSLKLLLLLLDSDAEVCLLGRLEREALFNDVTVRLVVPGPEVIGPPAKVSTASAAGHLITSRDDDDDDDESEDACLLLLLLLLMMMMMMTMMMMMMMMTTSRTVTA